MKDRIETLIVAGGSGSRMWPLARADSPKPFLPTAQGKSPLQRTVELAQRVTGGHRIWVVASQPMCRRIRVHLRKYGEIRSVIEPAPRDTAAAVSLGTATIRRKSSADWILCLPADQWVRKSTSLARIVRHAVLRSRGDSLVTFGIPASSARTGYGYMEIGSKSDEVFYRVRRFIEKPTAERASRLLRSGRWVWNSGMFLWRAEVFLNEVRRLLPEVYRTVEGLASGRRVERKRSLRAWKALRTISVDHGILEKAKKVVVSSSDIGWTDLGSWEALAETMARSKDGSLYIGKYLSVGGSECLVYSPKHLSVNVGVQGVGLIVTPDVVLMFKRGQDQRIRQVVGELRRRRGNWARYL